MALPIATTAPGISVHRRGLAKAPRGQKRIKTCAVESFSTRDIDESLDEGLWKTLPEHILDLILEQLPFAAQCRLRCVCRRWKEMQLSSPPPSVTIMSKEGDHNSVFYCDAERKWISLPSTGHVPSGRTWELAQAEYKWIRSSSDAHVPSGRTWELVDADAGLVCYRRNVVGWFWFWVCNPLKPSLSRIIKPGYAIRDRSQFVPRAPKTKLLVDRATGTYRIIAKADRLDCTSVYDSRTSRWKTTEECRPCMSSMDLFVLRNMLYAYRTEKDLKSRNHWLSVFNLRTRRWIDLTAKCPSEVDFPTKRFILSNNKEITLVLYSSKKLYRPYFSVWKLLDDAPKSAKAPFCEFVCWEKLELGSERDVADLRGHRLAAASYRGEDICFVFRGGKTTRDGSQDYQILRYSFRAKCWIRMPSRTDHMVGFGLHNWEPSLDIDPS